MGWGIFPTLESVGQRVVRMVLVEVKVVVAYLLAVYDEGDLSLVTTYRCPLN